MRSPRLLYEVRAYHHWRATILGSTCKSHLYPIWIYQLYFIYLLRINQLIINYMFFISITSKFDPKQQKTVLCPENKLEQCVNEYLAPDTVIVITESEVYKDESDAKSVD